MSSKHKLITGVVVAGLFYIFILQPLISPSMYHVDTIEQASTGDLYMVYSDSPCGTIGDPGWFIFKVNRPFTSWVEPKIPCLYFKGDTIIGNIPRGVIYLSYNYSESSKENNGDVSNPHLEIIDNKYLIFKRGGYKYSLYDMTKRQTIINYRSPWHEYDTNTGQNIEQEIDDYLDSL